MEEITLSGAICSQCSAAITSDSKFCTNCGFPENGNEKEKTVFHANRAIKNNQIKDDKEKVNSARKTLYWMAGISFASGLIYFFMTQDITELIAQAIIAVIYLILAYWSQKKPFAAILSGLLLYLTIIAIMAIGDPLTIFRGVFIKILIIAFLVKGVYSASQIAKR